MNTALIVAAGSGTRFAGDTPKQFVEIHGKSILMHTLERFDACEAVDEIVLVLSEAGRERVQISDLRSQIRKLKNIVIGGETRSHSVKNGLDSLSGNDDDIVAVHDGARPLVTVDEISRTIEKAGNTGAACLVAEVSDTIKKVDGGVVMATIDRSRLRRALTPQAFRVGLLKKAFADVGLNDTVTDECYLVEKLGYEIAAVEGSSRNIKITRPDDLIFAKAFFSEPPG